MQEMDIKEHYDAIDGLRAFSIIGIILMHVSTNGKYEIKGIVYDYLIPSFTNLVFLFMIISGFVVCCGYYDKVLHNKLNICEFYGKRYAKIWPFFALLCVMDLIISPSKEALYETFANLTLCFGLLPNTSMSVIGVGWFLGVVFVFYLLFPFFCYLLFDKKRAWISFGIALIFNILCEIYFKVGRVNFIYSAVFFLAGGMIFLYRRKLERIPKKGQCTILCICIVLCIGYYTIASSILLLLILFSLLLIYAIGSGKKRILQNRLTKFLADISMEIYLSHMVVFRAIEKIGGLHLFPSDILSYIMTVVGTVTGAIAFSLVVKKGFGIIGKALKNKFNNMF